MADDEKIHGIAAELRRLATYSAGVSDGLAQAATVVERCDQTTGGDEAGPARGAAVHSKETELQQPLRGRMPTMRPVLDVLRRAENSLSPSEIITRCRREGYDVRRASVQDALKRAVDQGVVEAVGGGRYRAVGG